MTFLSQVSHDGYRPQDSWLLKEIEVDVPTTGKKYLFTCECWLGKDKEDGKTARIFTIAEDQTVSYKPSKSGRNLAVWFETLPICYNAKLNQHAAQIFPGNAGSSQLVCYKISFLVKCLM